MVGGSATVMRAEGCGKIRSTRGQPSAEVDGGGKRAMLVVIGGEAERGKVEVFAQHADEPDGAELTGSPLLDDVTLMGVGQRRVQEGEVDAGGLVDGAKFVQSIAAVA
jgi:hypothetical protein